LNELCEQNNSTIEEIKEILEVLNYGEQCVIENEIQLGTNQIILMNIHRSAETKKEKRAHKQFTARKKKKDTKRLR
jgi:hypothetical protein